MTEITQTHRLTYKEKKSDKYAYARNFMDSVDVYSGSQSFSNYSVVKENMITNYDMFNNRIDMNDFMQYNEETEEDVIGKFQHYDIVISKLQALIGEMRKRPLNIHAYAINPEAFNERLEYKKGLLQEYFQYRLALAQKKDQSGQGKGVSLDDIEKQSTRNFSTAGEIDANNILKYHRKYQDFDTKIIEGFKDVLIVATTCHYVGEVDKKPVLELLNPLYLNYHRSPENKRIEESSWASYEYRLTMSDIYDRWGDDDEAMEQLNKRYGFSNYVGSSQYRASEFYDPKDEYYKNKQASKSFNRDTYDSQNLYQDELFRVLHVEWKSLRKIGFLTRNDIKYKEPIELIIDEEYKLNKSIGDVKIKWRWMNEVWEGYKVGIGPDSVYFGIKPKKIQFNNMNNLNSCKLGYHGQILNARNSEPVSRLDRGKPYQYMFIVISVQLERLLATDAGKVLIADVSSIPDNLTPAEWMHLIRQFKLALVDSSSMKAKKANFNQMGSQDLSVSANAISQRIQLLDYFARRCSEVMGITQQREGHISPQSNVSDNQQSIIQSSHSTEDDFATYDSYIERLMTSFVEVCKIVYKDNPLQATMLDHGSIIRINTENLSTYDYNVFIGNRSKDNDITRLIEQLAQPMMQNGYKISDVVTLLMDDMSLSKKIEDIRAVEQKLEQQQQQLAEQDIEMRKQELKSQLEEADKTRQSSQQIQNSRNQTDLMVKKMDVELQMALKDFDDRTSELSDFNKQQIEADKLAIDRHKDSSKLHLEKYKEYNKKSIEKMKQNHEDKRAKLVSDTTLTTAKINLRKQKKS